MFEPVIGTRDLTRWWAAGYVIFALLTAICAMVVRKCAIEGPAALSAPIATGIPLSWRTRLEWVFLSFVQRDRDDDVGGKEPEPGHEPRCEERGKRGANHAHATAPVAKPRRLGSYQLLANGMPTAKIVPAMPRKKPHTSNRVHPSCRRTNGHHWHDQRQGHDDEHRAAAKPVGEPPDYDAAQPTDEVGVATSTSLGLLHDIAGVGGR